MSIIKQKYLVDIPQEAITKTYDFILEPEDFNIEDRTFWHYISSNRQDRDGDIIDQKSFIWDNFNNSGKPVTWNHVAYGEKFTVVGINEDKRIVSDAGYEKTKAKTKLFKNMTENPNVAVLAEDIFNAMVQGYKVPSSMTFINKTRELNDNADGRFIMSNNDVLDYSLCIHNSNLDSIQKYFKTAKSQQIIELFEPNKEKQLAIEYIKELEARVAVLEEEHDTERAQKIVQEKHKILELLKKI